MANITSNALAPVTDDNHAGAAWIVAITSIFICLLAFGVRVWSRKAVLAVDDLACALATGLAVAQTAVLMVGLTQGLAKASDITSSNAKRLGAQVSTYLTGYTTTTCVSH